MNRMVQNFISLKIVQIPKRKIIMRSINPPTAIVVQFISRITRNLRNKVPFLEARAFKN